MRRCAAGYHDVNTAAVKCRCIGCRRKTRANHGFCYQHSEMRQVRVKAPGLP